MANRSKFTKKTTSSAEDPKKRRETHALLDALVGGNFTDMEDQMSLAAELRQRDRLPELINYLDGSAGAKLCSKALEMLSGAEVLDSTAMQRILAIVLASASSWDHLSMIHAVNTVAAHGPRNADPVRCLEVLESIVDLPNASPKARALAVTAMTAYADVRVIERLLSRNLNKPEEQKAVNSVVSSMLVRPFNVRRMSSAGFEFLVKSMLQARGRSENLKRTFSVVGKAYDGGIDVRVAEGASGTDDVGVPVVLVQCKNCEEVCRADVEEFSENIKKWTRQHLRNQQRNLPGLRQKADPERLFVTAALKASEDVRVEAGAGGITLILGEELRSLLKTHLNRDYEL
jgi:restriction endonuclease Mrr